MDVGEVWLNGSFIKEEDATVSVLAHALHYGSSFFEGIRAYQCKDDTTAVFRLDEHIERLYESCKIYKTEIPYSKEEVKEAICETIRRNQLRSAYIRPLVFRGKGQLGVNPRSCPVDVMIATWEWGAYLGEDGLENGVHVQISSWRRLAPDTIPALAKAGGNYLSSQLMKLEALDNGYDEAIALDYAGNISEGSGENIFIIKNNVIYTPPLAASSLFGITRDSVMKLATDKGYEIREQSLPREFLYTADEAFLTGTAAEITPIASVDKIPVGIGRRGPITKELQDAFFQVVAGEDDKFKIWLTKVNSDISGTSHNSVSSQKVNS